MPLLKILNNQVETNTGITPQGLVTSTYELPNIATIDVQLVVTLDSLPTDVFAAAAVNVGANTITIPAHGYTSGVRAALTTSGTVPAPLAPATTYAILVVDANTIQICDANINVFLNAPVILTSQGVGNHTLTPSAISTAVATLQRSNDATNWTTDSTVTVTAGGVFNLTRADVVYRYARVSFSLTAGRFNSTTSFVMKGYA